MWQCHARVVEREQHGDFFLLALRNEWDSQRLRKRARGFLHLGNIIQIPQCWIFDDAGKGKGVRHGGRREGGKMGWEESWWGKPEEGAALSQRRCSLVQHSPKNAKSRREGGIKEARNMQTAHLFICSLLLCLKSYFFNSGRDRDRRSCWWNTSITQIPRESVSACGRKGRRQTK